MKKKLLIATAMVALTAGGLLTAQSSRGDEAAFKAAQHKEQVDGDLKGAIKDYQKIAKGKDRGLAARALFQIAECYRALGDAQARKVYEDIVQNYSDQKEIAASARARLNSPGRASGTNFSMSKVWTNAPGPWISVSPDGRYVLRTDWTPAQSGTGDLVLHDLTTDSDRALTNTGTRAKPADWESAEEGAFSKDGKQIAYVWHTKEKRDELRIMSFQPAGFAPFRRFELGPDVREIASLDWSSDGKWISAQVRLKDRPLQLAIISADDGSLRLLKELGAPYVTNKSFLSPDGKYIAYDEASKGAPKRRDIFVQPVDGGPAKLAVGQAPDGPAYNMTMGWAPDGHLFYASDVTGSVSLWSLAMLNGNPQGAPVLVKSDLASVLPMGVTRAGALYYFSAYRGSELYMASIDLNSAKLTSNPARVPNQPLGYNRNPAWSPDGTQLGYVTQHNWGAGFGILSILSQTTRQTREVRDFTQLTSFAWISWSPDGRSVFAQGIDAEGKDGIYKVDIMGGGIQPLIIAEPKGHLSSPFATPDGRKLIYWRQTQRSSTASVGAMIERDLTSGAERTLLEGVNANLTGMPVLSPDGRYLQYVTANDATKEWTLSVLPIAGGASRELLQVKQPQSLGTGSWTFDSQSIIFWSPTSSGSRGYQMIGLTGGNPRKIDVPEGSTNLRISPNGQQVVFDRNLIDANELWAIENPLATHPAR